MSPLGWKRQRDTEEQLERTKQSVAKLVEVAAELNSQVSALEALVRTRNEDEKGQDSGGG